MGRQAAAFSADKRDNAEGAAVVATVLNFEGGPGVVAFAAEDGSDENVVIFENVTDEDRSRKSGRGNPLSCWRFNAQLLYGKEISLAVGKRRSDEVGDLRLVRVADYERDAGESGDFFRGALGVAAGDDDFCIWIGGMEFADSVAGLRVGGSGNGAAVDNDEIGGRGGMRQGTAAVEQLAFDRGPIGLGGAASELFDVKGGHGRDSLPFTVCGGQFFAAEEKAGPPPPLFRKYSF